ncbi:hypothetical protein ACP275_08G241900 [Erythranthe tilingii]
MDSGNSGSLHSSSGGDEEYDSRATAADSVSAFMSGGGGGGAVNLPPFFDPVSNYLQLHQNPNYSFLNPSLAWPRNSTAAAPRSDPNPNPNPITHHDTTTINNNNTMLPNTPPFMPSFRPPPAPGAGGADLALPPQQRQNQNQNQNQPAAARNPKKRSRASRRAPTTVLTTDTTNFRAMVQEFTGIPAPPFNNNNNSSFPRSRFDLFGTTTHLDAPPYLRRPFAQKVPFLPPSSSSLQLSSAAAAVAAASSPTNNNNTHNIITSVNSSTSINNEASSSSASNTNNNYQHSPNLFNNIIPTPLLTSFFQSNPNPKFPFSNHHHLINTKMGGLLDEQFGLGGGGDHVIISATDVINNNNNNNAAVWNSNNPDADKDDRINLNGAGSYSFPAVPENSAAAAAASRGEGMVESWICSSD